TGASRGRQEGIEVHWLIHEKSLQISDCRCVFVSALGYGISICNLKSAILPQRQDKDAAAWHAYFPASLRRSRSFANSADLATCSCFFAGLTAAATSFTVSSSAGASGAGASAASPSVGGMLMTSGAAPLPKIASTSESFSGRVR